MSPLVHCIYVSTAVHHNSDLELADLLVAARVKNRRLEVTGILLYMAGRFFQVLEGTSDVVESLYSTIKLDERHMDVTQIIFESIHARSFADWSMGMVDLSGDKLRQIASLSDPQSGSVSLAQLRDGRVKKLLLAFCEGRWGLAGAGAEDIP